MMKIKLRCTQALAAVFLFVAGSFNTIQAKENAVAEIPLMPSVITEDVTLDEGNILVTGTVRVKEGATLTILSGTNLIFNSRSRIIVDGGLNIKGEEKAFVNILSQNVVLPGFGFLIKGVNPDKSIVVEYARFDNLFAPLKFTKLWYRNDVTIQHNVIKNSPHGGAAVDIQLVDTLLADKTVQFNFESNTFTNNSSSILIADVSNSATKFIIRENVITRNNYSGIDRNGIYTCPLFMTYNESYGNQAVIVTNSVFDNFSSLYLMDTFEVNYTNVSIIGSRNDVDLSGNYFGDKRNDEIRKTFDFISSNYRAPYLHIDNTLSRPPANLNGHYYKVLINGNPLQEELYIEKIGKILNEIDIYFNRPVGVGPRFNVRYFYIKNDSFKYMNVDHRLTWIDNNQHLKVSIDNKALQRYPMGFLSIDGWYDENGFDVPRLDIGKKALQSYVPSNLASPFDFDMAIKRSALEDAENEDKGKGEGDGSGSSRAEEILQARIDSLKREIEKVTLEEDPINDSLIKQRFHFWDAGIFAGNAIYFGDMQRTGVAVNFNNFRPNVGFRARYHFSEKSSVMIANNNMYIYGTDRIDPNTRNPRGTGYARGLEVRTTVNDLAVMFEYNLMRYRSIKTFIPSLYAGVNAYYFKPMANYQGQWYDLRSMGTEGQLSDPNFDQYRKVMFGIPMGASIKRHLGQDFILGVSYTFNKIFTDYLDDVSTGQFQSYDDFQQSNPDNAEVAYAVSNPNGLSGSRSKSANFDAYAYLGVTLTYKIPNNKRKEKVESIEVTATGR
jgi:hypothetical protein